MYEGQVAQTYYSSSSGGHTEAVQDAWPGGASVPYLRSVADPWDTYSPDHDGGRTCTRGAARRAARAGRRDRVGTNSPRLESSPGVRRVPPLVGKRGEPQRLGHRKRARAAVDWFSIGGLSVSTSAPRVLYGSSVRVVARAVEAKGAVLQQQNPDGIWRELRHVHDKSVSHSSLARVPRSACTSRVRAARV